MLEIIIQNISILLIFAIIYEILYRWQNQFLKNRLFLLFSVVLSALIPFLSFNVFPYEIILQPNKETISNPNIILGSHTNTNWILIIYIIGLSLSFLMFIFRLIKIILLIKETRFEKLGKYMVSYNQEKSFNFLNYIFIEDKKEKPILSHEIAHASKYHTFDKIIIEIFTSLLWFNPVIYRFRFYLMENHEFEADSLAISSRNSNNIKMAEYLIQYSKSRFTNTHLLTHEFNSLMKNRIKMLAKSKFKSDYIYLIMIPIIIFIFSAFTFESYPVFIVKDVKTTQDTIRPTKSKIYRQTLSLFDSDSKEEIIRTIKTKNPSLHIWNQDKPMSELIEFTDTLGIFDSETEKETISAEKTIMPLSKYLAGFNLTGKTVSFVDSISYINPNNKLKYIELEKKIVPLEFKNIYYDLNYQQQIELAKTYGKIEVTTLIPGKTTLQAKVTVFDSITGAEETHFLSYKRPLETVLKEKKLSGKTTFVIDTIAFFDPDTYKESLWVYKSIFPIEFEILYGQANLKQQQAIIKEYGKVIKTKIK